MSQEHLLFTIYMPVHFTLSYPGLAKKLVLLENGTEDCINGGWGIDTKFMWIRVLIFPLERLDTAAV